jgi:RNA polymerase sigma factor (sigma-70 family)
MENIEKRLIEFDPLIVRLAKHNPVYGYDPEDLEQEFRMVFLKCIENFDDTKGAKFETYFITSCKNKVKKIQAKMYADKRPLIELSLNRIDKETGLEIINMYQANNDPDYDELLLQEITDSLASMENGEVTMDYFFEEMTYEQLAEKHGMTVSKVYRINTKNLESLRKIYQK